MQAIHPRENKQGFTIVELLIVVVVIAILAAITIVSFNGVTQKARTAALLADAKQASTQIQMAMASERGYPDTLPESIKTSDGTLLEYTGGRTTFCLTVYSSKSPEIFHITDSNGSPQEGSCPGHAAGHPGGPSIVMQTITKASCPTTRTRAVDARDNNTYWVQKLADGECWMLTNLAYAGGGATTYGDTHTITNGSSESTMTTASGRYYTPPSRQVHSTHPEDPLTTSGGAGQAGLLYNWCGMFGISLDCDDYTPPVVSTGICPAGWQIPNKDQYILLNTSINSGSSTDDSGLISTFLSSYAGIWSVGFSDTAVRSAYLSSTSSASKWPTVLYSSSTSNITGILYPAVGASLRCIAQ